MKRAKSSIVAAVLIAAGTSVFAQTSAAEPHVEWHGERFQGDIRAFHGHDWGLWRAGHWEHGFHDGRYGWWWLAGGAWYLYPAPVYPYPDPYVPPVAVVAPAPQATAVLPPPAQYWYRCNSPAGYYPYVQSCPGEWQAVPAAPAIRPPQEHGKDAEASLHAK